MDDKDVEDNSVTEVRAGRVGGRFKTQCDYRTNTEKTNTSSTPFKQISWSSSVVKADK